MSTIQKRPAAKTATQALARVGCGMGDGGAAEQDAQGVVGEEGLRRQERPRAPPRCGSSASCTAGTRRAITASSASAAPMPRIQRNRRRIVSLLLARALPVDPDRALSMAQRDSPAAGPPAATSHRGLRIGILPVPRARAQAANRAGAGEANLDFEYSDKTKLLMSKLQDFMDAHIYPNEVAYYRHHQAQADRWQTPPMMEELKRKAREAGLWNLFLPESERGAGLREPRVRPALRDHGARGLRAGGLQLRGARHRQHGGDRALRHGGPQEGMARAAARGTHPLRLRHDRAGRGFVRRHQHLHRDPPGRRRVRHQRPQVVDLGHPRPPLQDPDRDGPDGQRRPDSSPAEHDPGAARHAGRHGRALPPGLRLRRRSPRPR